MVLLRAPWRLIHAAVYRIPGVVALNRWANEKEAAWNRRRNASLAVALRDAGLDDLATRLDGRS